MLTKIGQETSLRYAIQLITASNLCTRKRKVDLTGISPVCNRYYLLHHLYQYLLLNSHHVPEVAWNGSCRPVDQEVLAAHLHHPPQFDFLIDVHIS